MSNPPVSRTPGSMTLVMSAARSREHTPRILRVVVIENTALTHERIFRERVPVTVGRTERCSLVVRGDALPECTELFSVTPAGYALRITDGMDGRIALPDGLRTVADCRALARPDGHALVLPLPETARGRITVGGVTFLFQFVPAPPVGVRPQLPASLKQSFARTVDWRYNACVAAFMAMAVGALGWVEYGWDPEVGDDSEAIELVSRYVHMDTTAAT